MIDAITISIDMIDGQVHMQAQKVHCLESHPSSSRRNNSIPSWKHIQQLQNPSASFQINPRGLGFRVWGLGFRVGGGTIPLGGGGVYRHGDTAPHMYVCLYASMRHLEKVREAK